MIDLEKCKVRWDKENYIPRKVHDFQSKPLKGGTEKIAKEFLKENLQSLKISDCINDLKFEKTVKSLGGLTILFQQRYKGTPIHGAWVAVHINRKNRVFMLKNDTVPVNKLKQKIPMSKTGFISSTRLDSIIKRKVKELGVLDTTVKKENMIYPLKWDLRPVWKLNHSGLKVQRFKSTD